MNTSSTNMKLPDAYNANNYVYNDHDRGSHTVELTFKDISTYSK